MHTIDELAWTDFEYRSNGSVVSRDAVMPDLTLEDRVGVVMGTGTEGLGAGNFILSCVTTFYDHLGETSDDFFEYPDFYTFQTTVAPADYRSLDIYPDHKNVSVEPTDETLLRAINDRAVTILLVPDEEPTPPAIEDITRRSAERRIERCYTYGADGQPRGAEFSIRLPRQPTAEWYETTARSVETIPDTYVPPSVDSIENELIQGFREIPLDEALSRFPTK